MDEMNFLPATSDKLWRCVSRLIGLRTWRANDMHGLEYEIGLCYCHGRRSSSSWRCPRMLKRHIELHNADWDSLVYMRIQPWTPTKDGW